MALIQVVSINYQFFFFWGLIHMYIHHIICQFLLKKYNMPVFRMIMINATSPFFYLFIFFGGCALQACCSQQSGLQFSFFSVINYYLKFNPVQYYTALYRLDAMIDLFSAFLLMGPRIIGISTMTHEFQLPRN